MNASHTAHVHESSHELRFESLFNAGRGYSFPCNAAGHVDMDALSERARINYLYARALVGIDMAHPQVLSHEVH